jgi:putative oxidoreductase
METQKIIYWAARIVAAVILGQTLFFKFTAAEESVALFTKLGVEPYGRIGAGIMELIACILLLINSKALWGGVLATGIMVGAIASHFLVIGIESNGDGGYLFMLAWAVMLCSLIVVWMNKKELGSLISAFKGKF